MMKYSVCAACENDLSTNHETFSFSPTSLHYPVAFDALKIVYCSRCGFSTTERPVDDQVLNEYYEKYYIGKAFKLKAKRTLKDFDASWFDTRAFSQMMLLRHFVEFEKVQKMYEVGPGEGASLVTVKKAFPHVELAVNEPQSFKEKLFKDLNVDRNQDIFNPKNPGKYDLIFMSHSLEHFNGESIASVLKTISDRLNPGGSFFCEVPNADLKKYPLAGEMVVPHLSFFSALSLNHFFKRAGLQVIFSNCAGDRQSSKKIDEAVIAKLKKSGTFEFEKEPSGRFWINRKLKKSETSRGSAQSLRTLLSQNRTITALKRRVSLKGPLTFLNQSQFQYSPDREFIRIIGRKQELH